MVGKLTMSSWTIRNAIVVINSTGILVDRKGHESLHVFVVFYRSNCRKWASPIRCVYRKTCCIAVKEYKLTFLATVPLPFFSLTVVIKSIFVPLGRQRTKSG